MKKCEYSRTDVAPNEEMPTDIAVPDDSVHAIDDVHDKQPKDDGHGGDIARTPVSGQRDQDEECGEKRADREHGITHNGDRTGGIRARGGH